MQDKEVDLEI